MAEDGEGGGARSSGSGPVHVCAAFNVAHESLPDFCEAACKLLAHAKADAGCNRFDLQRELQWTRQVSNEEHSLFMVFQEWASPSYVETHVRSPHAQRFDKTLVEGQMLVCAPSLSLFGPPLTTEGLAAMAAEARAAAAAEEAPAKKAPPPPPPFDPTLQPGVTLPLMYFDPAGFSKVGDEDGFRNLRAAELKHGRVAMMAALGAVLQHWIKFPGFEKVPSGIEAVTTPPGTFGFALVVLLAGAVETTVWVQDPEKEPGNFGDPLSVGQYYEEWRNRELNNGRMAMFAILGIIVGELVSGKDGVDQIWSSTVGNLPVE